MSDNNDLNIRVNYIMCRILNLLIEETKRVYGIDDPVVDCYKEAGASHCEQVRDFTGVDISKFYKVYCPKGFWNIRKSSTSSSDDAIYNIFTSILPDSSEYPAIVITKHGCAFRPGGGISTAVMQEAIPKIEELCKSFNDDTPENKEAFKSELSIKVNIVMSDFVNIIKDSFMEVFNECSIKADDFLHMPISRDIYDEFGITIDFAGIYKLIINSNRGPECYVIQKRSKDEAVFHILWNDFNANFKYDLDQFPTIKITKDSVTYTAETLPHISLEWQSIALPKIKALSESENECTKDTTTENETLDENFKNRISYIMDHVLDLLIDETKRVLNKNVVMVNCYESSKVNPSCLLDFKNVDISGFVKFICDCGSWDVRKSFDFSNDSRVTYYITWPRTGINPMIIITRNGCRFYGGDIPRNTLMNSALPKIRELCESFNDNTPENKDADKLVLNEGVSVGDVIGSNMINKQTDHTFAFHGRQVNLAEFATAPSRYGLIDAKTKQVKEVAHLIYRAFVYAIDEIAKEDEVTTTHMPAIQEMTWEWLFAYKNHDGDICLACIGDGDLDHYALWYRDPKGIKHIFLRVVVDNPGHITVYEGDRDAVTRVSARAKVKVKALVKEYNSKMIKSIAENHAFEYNKEEYKMEVKKDRCACTCKPIQDQIKDVIFNDPATTVLWKDGTKTTVKRMVTKKQTVLTSTGGKEVPVEMVPFDPEAALAAAIMNKLFGNHSKYAKFVKGYVATSENRNAAKKKKADKRESAKKAKDTLCVEEKVVVTKKKSSSKKENK